MDQKTKYDAVAVGTYIKQKRNYMNKTQEVFAEEAGICVRHLRDIEAGRKRMSLDIGVNIARVLQIISEDYYEL